MDLWTVSITLNIAGVVWSAFRELYVRELHSKLFIVGNQSMKVSTSMTFTIAELTKTIENDKSLSKHEREEFKRLVLDVEQRICNTVRDRTIIPQSHVVVNDFNGDNARVAQGQKVDQK